MGHEQTTHVEKRVRVRGARHGPGPREKVSEGAALPSGYRLDGSDPDVLVLRRPDGSFAVAFSAGGATSEAIEDAAQEDRRSLSRPPPAV